MALTRSRGAECWWLDFRFHDISLKIFVYSGHEWIYHFTGTFFLVNFGLFGFGWQSIEVVLFLQELESLFLILDCLKGWFEYVMLFESLAELGTLCIDLRPDVLPFGHVDLLLVEERASLDFVGTRVLLEQVCDVIFYFVLMSSLFVCWLLVHFPRVFHLVSGQSTLNHWWPKLCKLLYCLNGR